VTRPSSNSSSVIWTKTLRQSKLFTQRTWHAGLLPLVNQGLSVVTRPRLRTLVAHVCRMDTAVDGRTSFAHGLRVYRDAAAAIAAVGTGSTPVLGCRFRIRAHAKPNMAALPTKVETRRQHNIAQRRPEQRDRRRRDDPVRAAEKLRFRKDATLAQKTVG
jgi:hypothetical protein